MSPEYYPHNDNVVAYEPASLAYLEAFRDLNRLVRAIGSEALTDRELAPLAVAEHDYANELLRFFQGKQFGFSGYVADILDPATSEFRPYGDCLNNEPCTVEVISLSNRYKGELEKYPMVHLSNPRGLVMRSWLNLTGQRSEEMQKFLTWKQLKSPYVPDRP